MNVIFLCGWGKTPAELLNNYSKFTKDNIGLHGNIKGCSDIDLADIVCLMGDVNIDENVQMKLKEKIVIKIPREPFNNNEYDNIFHVVTTPSFINKSYNELIDLKYLPKQYGLSAVISNKNYPFRRKFIINFSKIYPTMCDIFGYGWKNELGDSYKGPLNGYHGNFKIKQNNNLTKFDALINYRYSLCIENCSKYNYFSEKFTDAILCWSIPIYYGCPNINEYFPQGCYYFVDITKPDCHSKIIDIIKKPITQKNIEALKKARTLILNNYNIWAVLENMVTHLK